MSSSQFVYRRQLETLLRANQQVNAVLDVPVILRTLVRSALELVDAGGGMAGVVADGLLTFAEYHLRGGALPIDLAVPVTAEAGVISWVRDRQLPYVTNAAATDPRLPPDLRQRFGIESLLALPLIDGRGEVLGHLELHNKADARPFGEADVAVLQGLAAGAVIALQNARLLRQVREADARAQFLAEASAVLASSLDYEATLASLARLAVPHLADWSSVYVSGPDGRLRHLAVAHSDPAKVAWAQEIGRRFPPGPDDRHGVGKVLRTGQSEIAPRITDDQLAAAARDPDHLRLLRELGLRSCMLVPLTARGRTLGVLTFVAAESGRTYGLADLAMAEDLARRAALAVDNARLYQEEQAARRQREEAMAQLGVLVEASARLTSTLDLPALLAGILGLANRLIAADAYAIWRFRPEAAEWEIAASAGLSEGYLRGAGRILAGNRIMPDRPMAAEDVEAATLLENRRAAYRAEGIRSLLALPLVIHGQVAGTLVFYHRTPRAFPEATVRLATALGNLAGAAIGTAELYTRESQLRQQAQEADRRKDQFLAMLGHELRNPLHPILNSLHVLRLGADAAAGDQARRMIERQARHMARLVDDLLDVSRISRGKIHLRRARLDLAQLVRTTVEDLRPMLDRAQLTVRVEVPSGPVGVHGDGTRLAQILHNLLDNAAKFTDAGKTVWVRLAVEEGRAVLVVRDEGIGLEPELIPRLFDPFAQADRSLDRARGGLGLGLALVKGLAELHGGDAWAVSPGPGRGAEFRVRLPLDQPPPAPAANGAVAVPPGGPRRVLLIEDNPDAAESLKLLLELLGYEVRVAFTGPDGLQAAGAWRPDVILCDLGLPGLDGFGVAARLRSQAATAAVPLIAVSGYGSDEDRRRSRAAGFDHHLVKPVDLDELQRLLAAAPAATS